ncbi:protein ROS1-like [Vigna radiata var. radiata]|uniref:Protein ROS1-like n=1 Tax=Vigna radiata var. radiata TaxID=3916 RepID=A0A3Q0END2_VIGRR|nr:protein ROS1-like [Vigna radiata var. radiata]
MKNVENKDASNSETFAKSKIIMEDDVRGEFDLPSSSKKRKKMEDINDELPRKKRKKVFRPKLVSQIPKRRKKSQVKSNTPKPSTPEQRENNIRKGGYYCERKLFNEDSSNASNEIGIQHNSVQSYQKVSSLSGLCVLKENQIGSNFPFLFKKKRVLKRRLHLLKFLTPIEKRRSKWFTRKRREKVDFSVEDSNFKNKMLINRIKKFSSLMTKDKSKKINELDNCTDSRKKLVLHKKAALNDSLLDEETSRMWGLLQQEKGYDENDEMKRKYWENIRKIYQCKVESFIDHMHFIQGDRRFLPWKGSVLDSVIGVFLTQNVADYLSSSAFMSLASKFSLEKKEETISTEFQNEKEKKEDEDKNDEKVITRKSLKNDEKKKTRKQKEQEEEMKKKREYWDLLRKIYTKNFRSEDYMDSVDWEAVRVAKPRVLAQTIASRGQHNIIGGRVQTLLNSLMESNGSLDLEWLRYAPPKDVKEYLLAIEGLGLKSVECIRLLALRHTGFPVDINVARIVVRLGWVPIQPLPEYIQIHNLEIFPDSDKIQEYLWPRLCTLDPPQLYELHYQLITFGKVFCTKQKPNCNACPLKSECKYFASAFSREKLALPESKVDYEDKTASKFALPEPTCLIYEPKTCEPTIELPPSPEHVDDCKDIEDISKDYYNSESNEDISLSTAIITPYADHIPMQKMKDVSRLKTERLVYVLPDNHPLLSAMQCEQRQADDPCPYLLILWERGELEDSCESNLDEEANTLTIPATLLIPCRSAMRSRFPLNGTYFQVNEVFVDYASMIHPINVPRKWLWNLDQRIVYIGTTVSSIMRGLSLVQIQDCFWNGFVCVRAFDVKTRAPRPISEMLHRNTTAKLRKGKGTKK